MKRLALLVPVALVLGACERTPGSVLIFPESGLLQVSTYMDETGDGQRNPEEPGIPGLQVFLRYWNTFGPLDQGVTDGEGEVSFPTPVGTLRVDPDSSFLGDSLVVVESPDNPFTIRPDSTVFRQIGLSYPTVSLNGIAGLEPGRRVFTSGIALNSRENFGDGEVHLRLGGVALRATRVERVGVVPGDSVRIVGRTRVQDGRMTLDSARIFVVTGSASLVQAQPTSTLLAATAAGGSRDAWLVQVTEARVEGIRMDGQDRIVTVDDGSGPLDLVLRGYLQFETDALVPGATVVRGAGLLRPVPGGPANRWRLFPRGSSDLALRAPPPPTGG